MKILHVTPYFADAWAYGGIPRVASVLTRELAARGHRVTVFTTDACGASERLSSPSETAGVEVCVFPNVSNQLAYRAQLFLPMGMEKALRARAREFDVAHLHGLHNLPGAIASRVLWRAGVPYFVAPHGTAPLIERRRLAKWIFDRTLGREVLPHAHLLIAVSEAERRQLLELGIAPDRIRVAGNPFDPAELDRPPAPGKFRNRLGLGAAPVVLFLGKLTPRKRVDTLLSAFALLRRPDAQLVVAGNDLGVGASLRRQARALRLTNRVHFTGLLTGAARLEALSDATVVAYPSSDEVFGLVALEAALCGTPVIAANDSGCGELVASLGAGLTVPVGDARALAAALEEVLADPPRWRAALQVASRRARERFSASSICARIEAVYLSALPASEVPAEGARPGGLGD